MSTSIPQTCPICGVKIEPAAAGDRVMFSSGAPGTRAKLWARVCRYVEKPGCINQNRDEVGEVKPSDYYHPDPLSGLP